MVCGISISLSEELNLSNKESLQGFLGMIFGSLITEDFMSIKLQFSVESLLPRNPFILIDAATKISPRTYFNLATGEPLEIHAGDSVKIVDATVYCEDGSEQIRMLFCKDTPVGDARYNQSLREILSARELLQIGELARTTYRAESQSGESQRVPSDTVDDLVRLSSIPETNESTPQNFVAFVDGFVYNHFEQLQALRKARADAA